MVMHISEAAKEVGVETHVLRYWESELGLCIERDEKGHRIYGEDKIRMLQKVKQWKEKGIGLRAIRELVETKPEVAAAIVEVQQAAKLPNTSEDLEQKAQRIQILLSRLIAEAVKKGQVDLAETIKTSVTEELDYYFRKQEAKEEERELLREEREEEHYRKLDALLRGKRDRKRKKHSLI